MNGAQTIRTRALITKAFGRYGLKTIRPDALEFLEDLIVAHEIEEDAIQTSMELLAKQYLHQEDQGNFVSKPTLQKVYESMQDENAEAADVLDADADLDNHLHFIDAFEMPWWQYSLERQTFEKPSRLPTAAGEPESRARMYRDRLQIIRRIILRNEHFAPAAFQSRDKLAPLKLRSTKDLLGHAGSDTAFMLFGMLAYTPKGHLCLEDLDGRVILDISSVEPGEGLYTEGCMVMVEGVYNENEILEVHAIGHPPCERRKRARDIDGHFDFLGKGASTLLDDITWKNRMKEFEHVAFVVISDLWLDEPRIPDALRRLFEKCIALGWLPKVFIFCGNFSSTPIQGSSKDLERYQDGFDELGNIITSYSAFRDSHFVFVPGPNDVCGSSVFPRPPLLPTITQRLKAKIGPKAHFMSNPCRIHALGQEIVIFREDMMAKFLRNLITHKPGVSDDDLKKYLFQTILDQCHLSPLPQSVQPILPEYDHTMRLYPLPTTLILADKYQRYQEHYEGCHVFNPGSFLGNQFGFSTYFPHSISTEESELDAEEQEAE
ncbi:epsilon DNA polymerase [Auriculariales sp. MPI-PUGE-AT-0066]|nr:epsilon DNA polymerase [Auriculariales sp. MPI-PUGE-AT-0066]